MLELYYSRPKTIDRIQSSWIAEPVEQYVSRLTQQKFSWRTVSRRIPILLRFGEFARTHGAICISDLPCHVEPFILQWLKDRCDRRRSQEQRKKIAECVRNPIRQMLRVGVPGYVGMKRPQKAENPFEDIAPGFFDFLRHERGLKTPTLLHYSHYLHAFASYLRSVELRDLRSLTAPVLSAFVMEYGRRVTWPGLRNACGTLRVFLRYLYRQKVLASDLSRSVEFPVTYRLSGLPRSIGWEDVRRLLTMVDQRSPVGKRDYAMLLLLITYGLRGCEVAALTLDDVEWRNERLRIPERKAGHSTAYPLSPVVGQAIADYVQKGRPKTTSRKIFFRSLAPQEPITSAALSARVAMYLKLAGIQVPRPGSHTLRHTCVQRLVDADFSLKVIGDYVGHRSPSSTQIYAKVAVDALREVACGDVEAIL